MSNGLLSAVSSFVMVDRSCASRREEILMIYSFCIIPNTTVSETSLICLFDILRTDVELIVVAIMFYSLNVSICDTFALKVSSCIKQYIRGAILNLALKECTSSRLSM